LGRHACNGLEQTTIKTFAKWFFEGFDLANQISYVTVDQLLVLASAEINRG
jgi:hypothetical protein